MRPVLVHERFTEMAGSENVVKQMRLIWPLAPVVAPIADPSILPEGFKVQTSPAQRLYRGGKSYAHLLPVLPVAMSHLPLPPHDVVVASHHAFANRVVRATDRPVVSYVHSPARWMWDAEMRRGELGGALGERALAAFSATQRHVDYAAAARVTAFAANSTEVARRIERWWNREASVVHPPVNVDFYSPGQTGREDFVLLAGRLVPYKRPELAVQAARLAGLRLVVVGEGRALDACRSVASERTTFLGRVSDEELRSLYQRARLLVMPGVEDFGIIPVEAQACGTPVVALGAGGALDTVRNGITGLHVEPSEDSATVVSRFAEAMADAFTGSFDNDVIRAHAETFSEAAFRANLVRFVAEATGQHTGSPN